MEHVIGGQVTCLPLPELGTGQPEAVPACSANPPRPSLTARPALTNPALLLQLTEPRLAAGAADAAKAKRGEIETGASGPQPGQRVLPVLLGGAGPASALPTAGVLLLSSAGSQPQY